MIMQHPISDINTFVVVLIACAEEGVIAPPIRGEIYRADGA
jgi:hypothetical protein